MWPSKKDKWITIPPGKSVEINFGVEWRKDKEEVVIITDNDKFVLDGKNELFLEVTSGNTDTIKVQIVPDFKKRTINVIEVIDANANQTTGKNKGKISLVGIDPSADISRGMSRNMSNDISITTSNNDIFYIDKYLEAHDKNIESFGKRISGYKTRRNIFIIFAVVVIVGNAYIFTISSGYMKYINMVAIAIIAYVVIRLWNAYKDLDRAYKEYKENRSKVFEVVKNQ
jgi:hypothetical protein